MPICQFLGCLKLACSLREAKSTSGRLRREKDKFCRPNEDSMKENLVGVRVRVRVRVREREREKERERLINIREKNINLGCIAKKVRAKGFVGR
ncbi:hypothetical protein M0802_013874 [Mischocyttarus mexicanus]|nr:hypothetical protein M0802_013874 [Mischocyttarus mexicanus]